jgi:hypothetical protein
MNRPFFGMVAMLLLAAVGCRSTRDSLYDGPAAERHLHATVLQYVDSDGFDALFETSLINQDPVIIVRTDNDKPDWDGRLNAWIAAWNAAGKTERRILRGQIPLPSQIDADFLREFRLLVFGVVDHAEELAKAGATWWREERTRSRRVALLRRYNLRFHLREDGRIDLIFFNGNYADKYRDFMTTLTGDEEIEWSRSVDCSMCRKLHEATRTPPPHFPLAVLDFEER